MEIRVWRSYSSNNSTSYRIIGRFEDANAAAETAVELNGFFKEAMPLAEHLYRPRKLNAATSFPFTEAVDALAKKHGFDWAGLIAADAYDDELEVVAEGSTIILYHPYCLGLGEDLPSYLRARGAAVEGQQAGDPAVSAIFRLPDDGASMRAELTAFFAQADSHEDTQGWTIKPPWSSALTVYSRSTELAFFCDRKTAGFYLKTDPSGVALLKTWLERAGVREYSLQICELADLAKFRTIARARCEGCQIPLEYIDMREHAIAADQLACSACGGMFDLDAFPSE